MISAVVLTKDEENNIKNCLESLAFCDELIVVDDHSSDKTTKIAQALKAKVYTRSLNNDFSSQRNFGLLKAKGDWVLFVDADEVVGKRLSKEIVNATRDKYDGYFIKRQDVFMKKKMRGGEWGEQWLLRFGKKGKGKWRREVHEKWEIEGKISKLSSPLLHSPTFSLDKMVEKIKLYSSLHAKSNQNEGKSANLVKIIIMPFFKFIYNFFIKRGYRDGTHGFVYTVLMSFHSFLAWSILWTNSRKIK